MSDDIRHKVCLTCKESLPEASFWKDRSRRDGYEVRCKNCKNREYNEIRFPKMKHTESYKLKHRIGVAKSIKLYPERQKARILARSVPLGITCENCGDTGRLHRHHDDYSKPLEVTTLCVPCHERVHHGVKA